MVRLRAPEAARVSCGGVDVLYMTDAAIEDAPRLHLHRGLRVPECNVWR